MAQDRRRPSFSTTAILFLALIVGQHVVSATAKIEVANNTRSQLIPPKEPTTASVETVSNPDDVHYPRANQEALTPRVVSSFSSPQVDDQGNSTSSSVCEKLFDEMAVSMFPPDQRESPLYRMLRVKACAALKELEKRDLEGTQELSPASSNSTTALVQQGEPSSAEATAEVPVATVTALTTFNQALIGIYLFIMYIKWVRNTDFSPHDWRPFVLVGVATVFIFLATYFITFRGLTLESDRKGVGKVLMVFTVLDVLALTYIKHHVVAGFESDFTHENTHRLLGSMAFVFIAGVISVLHDESVILPVKFLSFSVALASMTSMISMFSLVMGTRSLTAHGTHGGETAYFVIVSTILLIGMGGPLLAMGLSFESIENDHTPSALTGLLATTIFDFVGATLAVLVAVIDGFRTHYQERKEALGSCEEYSLNAVQAKLNLEAEQSEGTKFLTQKLLEHAIDLINRGGCGPGKTAALVRKEIRLFDTPPDEYEKLLEMLDSVIAATSADVKLGRQRKVDFVTQAAINFRTSDHAKSILFACIILTTAFRDILQTAMDLKANANGKGVWSSYYYGYSVFAVALLSFIVFFIGNSGLHAIFSSPLLCKEGTLTPENIAWCREQKKHEKW